MPEFDEGFLMDEWANQSLPRSKDREDRQPPAHSGSSSPGRSERGGEETSEAARPVHVRKRWLLLVAVVLIACGALIPLFVQRPSRITKAAFERIELDMSLAEVQAILGGPAGDYRTGSVGYAGHYTRKTDGLPHEWAGDEGIVLVEVDRDGRVLAKHFIAATTGKPGLIDRLRWRFDR
jgi:hypothetical protein